MSDKRYSERNLELYDVPGRFEANSAQYHVYNAIASIDRLKDDGIALFDRDSNQFERWISACDELKSFLNQLGTYRTINKVPVKTCLRDFFSKFEHETHRLHQLAYEVSEKSAESMSSTAISEWTNLIYRFSTYGIVAYWIDEKHEYTTIDMKVNLSSGEVSSNTCHKPMPKPKNKKHKIGMRKLK